MRFVQLLSILLLVQFSTARAALISATFNDLTAAALSGQGGGTGLSGNWSGSANPNVVASDLTSTLYNKPQSGTPQLVSGTNQADSGIRQNYRTPSVTLAGEIWFSFLVRENATSGGRSGLSFNAPNASPFNDRGTTFLEFQAGASNVDLVYQFGTGSPTTVSSVVSGVTSTILVVGKLNMAGGAGSDAIKIWVNPDLMANPDINVYTPVVNLSGTDFIDSITRLGVITYKSTGSGNGNFDNLWISDGNGNTTQAFVDVTGVPEPSSIFLIAFLIAGFVAGRKLQFKTV